MGFYSIKNRKNLTKKNNSKKNKHTRGTSSARRKIDVGGTRCVSSARDNDHTFTGGALWRTAIIQDNNTASTTIVYGDKTIKCEICGKDQFAHIDASIERSKTMTFFFNTDENSTGHPIKLYRCKECNNCKIIYNGLGVSGSQKILEK